MLIFLPPAGGLMVMKNHITMSSSRCLFSCLRQGESW